MRALSGLNSKQKEAVEHTEGPLLIIAGAGAGKTKTLTHRILHLIEKGVPAESILAVTFTNKAAREMSERVRALVEKGRLPFISTFHALCVYILRQHARMINYPRHFSILDKEDALSILKRAMESRGISPKTLEPRKVLAAISREKNNLISQREYEREARSAAARLIAGLWAEYERITRKEKSFDFDDLLVETVRLLRENEDIRTSYQREWHYIHIDEYQDTNAAQYALTELLTGKNKNLCVVGDADQSIYGWRGADFRNILNFEQDYPDAKVVVLEENYRSTQTIIAAANEVIGKNKERKEKNLFTKNKVGEKIGLIAALNEGMEARAIAEKSRELITRGHVSPADIAVLYRANFQSRALEEAFLAAGVPYRVFGVRFFERAEVKAMLSYLRAAQNPDDIESVKRILNVPKRGLGKATLAKIYSGERATLPKATEQKVESFFQFLERIRAEIGKTPVSSIFKFIVKESGWEKELLEGGEEGIDRLENIRELVTLASVYDTLPSEEGVEKLLTDAALLAAEEETEEKEAEEAVRLMTVHAAKGLEFGYVFVAGLEQDLFPHARVGGSTRDAEEERRLFYVALTRAKEKLFLAYAQVRTLYGSRRISIPSEFLMDISDDLLETEVLTPLESEDVIEWD